MTNVVSLWPWKKTKQAEMDISRQQTSKVCFLAFPRVNFAKLAQKEA
jgi:hypothetical protein